MYIFTGYETTSEEKFRGIGDSFLYQVSSMYVLLQVILFTTEDTLFMATQNPSSKDSILCKPGVIGS